MKLISAIEDDPIIQVPSQEPLTSSESIMEARDLQQSYNHASNLKTPLPSPPSGTINILQVPHGGQGALNKLIIILES